MPNPISSYSSSSANASTYDVFLSFWGQDVRSGFARDLFDALRKMEVNTFMDDKKLRKGEEITPEIMKLIQQSRICIVIFSQNYASSVFCLEELVKIVLCNKDQGWVVLPVFFKVDPYVVRHQTGSYKEALTKHEERIQDKKIIKWRSALRQAADLLGWHVKNQGEQRKIIGEITQKVSNVIHGNNPTGLDQSLVHKGKALTGVKLGEGLQTTSFVGIKSNGGLQATSVIGVNKSNGGVQPLVSVSVKSNDAVQVTTCVQAELKDGEQLMSVVDVKSKNEVLVVQGTSGIRNQFQNLHIK